jgi:hypothetical protein
MRPFLHWIERSMLSDRVKLKSTENLPVTQPNACRLKASARNAYGVAARTTASLTIPTI